ncbi:MAG: N-acetylmannosamine-6-phosphate 2-epimerase [Pedococcus sp.]
MRLPVLEAIRSRLVVSCQAYPGEPMRDPGIMTAVARAVVDGGAAAIRAQGLEDLHSIRAAVSLPLIGLVKRGDDGVFITPTCDDCVEVARTGAEVVALDGTTRPRPDGSTLRQCIETIHDQGALAMADCGSVADAVASIAAGADCIGTTLAGYTSDRPLTDGPDFDLLRDLVAMSSVPVLAEGRITTPREAAVALQIGAHAVVVGSAITHPTSITRRFATTVSDVARGEANSPSSSL